MRGIPDKEIEKALNVAKEKFIIEQSSNDYPNNIKILNKLESFEENEFINLKENLITRKEKTENLFDSSNSAKLCLISKIQNTEQTICMFKKEVCELFSKYMSKYSNEIQEVRMLAQLSHKNLYGYDANIEDAWVGIIKYGEISVKERIAFMRKIPGLSDNFDKEGFVNLINKNLINFLVHKPIILVIWGHGIIVFFFV